jgi:hypothetical protein
VGSKVKAGKGDADGNLIANTNLNHMASSDIDTS